MRHFGRYCLLFLSTLSCCVVSSLKISHGPKVVIDHDGGADDAMALFIALLREQYFNGPTVVALTTVHGNVNETQCFVNTQRILDVAGRRDVPIYRGSRNALIRDYPSDHFFGTDGLGDNEYDRFSALRAQPDHAVFALIELSKKYKGELIVITLAPLTNIALAIRIDPDFIGRLKHLYIGAGHIYGPSYTEPEFNALLDVEAYYIAVQAATPGRVTVIPFSQIKESIQITRDWRTKVLGSIKTKIMKAQNEFEDISLPTSDKWQLLDPAVMALALHHSIVGSAKLSKNSIILCVIPSLNLLPYSYSAGDQWLPLDPAAVSAAIRPSLVEEYKYSQNDIIRCGEYRGINTNKFVPKVKANVRVIYLV